MKFHHYFITDREKEDKTTVPIVILRLLSTVISCITMYNGVQRALDQGFVLLYSTALQRSIASYA